MGYRFVSVWLARWINRWIDRLDSPPPPMPYYYGKKGCAIDAKAQYSAPILVGCLSRPTDTGFSGFSSPPPETQPRDATTPSTAFNSTSSTISIIPPPSPSPLQSNRLFHKRKTPFWLHFHEHDDSTIAVVQYSSSLALRTTTTPTRPDVSKPAGPASRLSRKQDAASTACSGARALPIPGEDAIATVSFASLSAMEGLPRPPRTDRSRWTESHQADTTQQCARRNLGLLPRPAAAGAYYQHHRAHGVARRGAVADGVQCV